MLPKPAIRLATKERLPALLCVLVVVLGAILALTMYTIGAGIWETP